MTLIDQGHLSLHPLATQPVYWEYDYALRLNPTPDALILAEDHEAYSCEYNGAFVFNPGSFGIDGVFSVFRPSTKRMEVSSIHPMVERSSHT